MNVRFARRYEAGMKVSLCRKGEIEKKFQYEMAGNTVILGTDSDLRSMRALIG
jgi:hypothetical protein